MTAHDYAASVLGHALAYAQRGWHVIPIMPGEKRPTMAAWQDRATTQTAVIMGWYESHPEWGVGIATGSKSGLWATDVDTSDGKRGDETLADLEATHDKLPATVESITGSGGRHLLFKWPTDGDIHNDAGKRLGPGLDIRGEGGVIVAPPTIHPNGKPYLWEAMSSPLDGIALAYAPEWLLRLIRGAILAQAPRGDRKPLIPREDGVSLPGDEFAAIVSWRELLMSDGASYLGTRIQHNTGQPYELWARPGVGDHAGATLYYGGSDVLKVFSSNWPGLEEGRTYTRFGYFAATRFRGDHGAAARSIREGQADALVAGAASGGLLVPASASDAPQGPTGADPGGTENPTANAALDELGEAVRRSLVDWDAFWQREHVAEEWVAFPIIPAARSIAIYAPGKTGKSLFVLDIVAALVSGRPILGGEIGLPVDVFYADLEMSEVDLYDRMASMGYGPEVDLSRLHYAALPAMPPLDTPEGAAWMVKAVEVTGAKAVIIDTLARAVKGDEDKADTVRAFFRWTGTALKRLGVAVLRLDHSGKKLEKGQRGSSAKNDDVDVVFQLTQKGGGKFLLKRELSRVPWVPEAIHLERKLEPYVHHVIIDAKTRVTVDDVIEAMDRLGIDPNIGMDRQEALLKAAGEGRNTTLVREAIRKRRERDHGQE